MPDVMSFSDAITHASRSKPPHVLLGNGFSIACRPTLFRYDRLLDRADLSTRPAARAAFDRLNTTDFETVIRALSSAAMLAEVYNATDRSLAEKFHQDAEVLKDVLVETVAGSHPDLPRDIVDEECAAARRFMSRFDKIYTLNYDLLTYWACMRSGVGCDFESDDGFRQPDGGPQDWVVWDPNQHGQKLYYLHGALHIYQSGPEIRKYTWVNTGIPLMGQIRSALDEGSYPIFVAEGTWQEKMERIQRSSFLGRAYRSFREIGGSLFAYGLSFSEQDKHILTALVKSKVKALYVSIYGDPGSQANRELINRVEMIRTTRVANGQRAKNLDVYYFDAESAHVWRSPA